MFQKGRVLFFAVSFIAITSSFAFPSHAYAALSRTALDHEIIDPTVAVPLAATTTSFTPPSNSLLVVTVSGYNQSNYFTVSVAGGGLSWTKRVDSGWTCLNPSVTYADCDTPALVSDYRGKIQIWTAPVTTGAPMTVTVSGDITVTSAEFNIQAIAYTGYNTSNPVGVSTSTRGMGDGAGSMTFPSAPSTASEVLAARFRSDNNSVDTTATPGSGWTEIYDDTGTNGGADLQSMFRGSSNSTSVTWNDISDDINASSWVTSGAALEINAAATVTGRVIRLTGGVRLRGGVRLQ